MTVLWSWYLFHFKLYLHNVFCIYFEAAEFSVYILCLFYMPRSDTNKITTKINQKKRPYLFTKYLSTMKGSILFTAG